MDRQSVRLLDDGLDDLLNLLVGVKPRHVLTELVLHLWQRSLVGRVPNRELHDDLVQREFTADAPNRLWLTDITEHPTREGKLYLCAVKDVWSRRIVGYSIADRMTSQLAVDALGRETRGEPKGPTP